MSGSSSRRKGMVYENQVYNHVRFLGMPVEKRNRSGYDGDDLLIKNELTVVSVECKNQKAMSLAAWLDQATANAQQVDRALPAVIHKRVGRSNVGQHYATMSVDTFLELIRRTS